MKKSLFFILALSGSLPSFAQSILTPVPDTPVSSNVVVQNQVRTFSYAQTKQFNLSGVTLGFGAGPHTTFGKLNEYSLSPDTNRALHVEGAAKSGFVISSVITVRLGRVAKQKGSGKLLSQQKINTKVKQLNISGDDFSDQDMEDVKAKPHERWAINLAINLADVTGSGLAFNKYIDGGLGVGYYFNDHIQLGAFFDLMRYRQLRQYIVDQYAGKSIPNGGGIHTALDPTDNSLFTTKTFAGVSLKLIYTLNATND